MMRGRGKPRGRGTASNIASKRLEPATSSSTEPQPVLPEEPRAYSHWNTVDESALIEWFESEGNYDVWKCTGKDPKTGKKKTSGKSKASILRDISAFLKDLGFYWTPEQIGNKIKSLEKSYKDAACLRTQTGSGITAQDEEEDVEVMKDKILKYCPLWDRLHPIYGSRPSMVPPFLSDNTVDSGAAAERILIGDGLQDEEDTSKESSAEEQPEASEQLFEVNAPENQLTPGKRKPEARISKTPPAKKILSVADALVSIGRERAEIDNKRILIEERKLALEEKRLEIHRTERQAELELQKAEMVDKKVRQEQEFQLRKMELENQRFLYDSQKK